MSDAIIDRARRGGDIPFPLQALFEVWLVAGPLLMLAGHAASDIWLTSLAIVFLVLSAMRSEWDWTRALWFRAAVLFWIWSLVASAFSPDPLKALEVAAPWIRFPVFAAALWVWLGESKLRRVSMLTSAAIAVAILVGVLLVERISNPDASRLYGTFTQGPKPGWVLFGIGLPVALFALDRARRNVASALWALPAVLAIFTATVLTGEIMMMAQFALGLVLYVLLTGINRTVLIAGLMIAVGAAAIAIQSPPVVSRVDRALTTRLPWLESSDYYAAWRGNLETGFMNPVVGIGPHAYKPWCLENLLEQNPAIRRCDLHAHQVFLQSFAETGLPGAVLLALMTLGVWWRAGTTYRWKTRDARADVALVLAVTALWPIATYSNLFGQHRNIFLAFQIGLVLALVFAVKSEPEPETEEA